MRIECENCGATYSIDDAQIGSQPIGAQCPYCGHVKVIRPGSGPDADVDWGEVSLTTPSGQESSSSVPSLLGPGFDLDLPESESSMSGGSGAEAFSDSAFEVTRSRPPPGVFSGVVHPEEALGLVDSAEAAHGLGDDADVHFCQECGVPLTDEFDRVIGRCEAHQMASQAGSSEPPPLGSSGPATWFARTGAGGVYGPASLESLRARLRAGDLPLDGEFSCDGHVFRALTSFPELGYLAKLGPAGGAARWTARGTPTPQRLPEPSRYITPLLLGCVVLGMGVLTYTQRDQLARVYRGVLADEGPDVPRRANPLRPSLANWRRAHPDVSGTVRHHLEQAEALHLEDTWTAYERAERAFQRALILDEDDVEAMAGYVENLALWRYPLASATELAAVRNALEYALELEPDSGPVRRAVGALALASGDLDGCRAGAEAALEGSPHDERARLLLAGCYLEGNVQLSTLEAETVRSRRPDIRRAERVLAEAYRRGGRFKSAYQILDARLERDPRNAALHVEYGHLEAALARYDEAVARYRRALQLTGDRQAALLSLGRLALERRQRGQAIGAFQRAASLHPPAYRRGATLYAEWARAELERRSYGRAIQLAEQALKLEPKWVTALLVKSEAALALGEADVALEFVERALKEREDEPVARILRGRIAARRGNRARALQEMRRALKHDPKEARLYAVLAAEYLEADKAPQAYATMRKTVELDPARAWAVRRNTALSVNEASLREAIRRFEGSARDPRNASVAYASIGLILYHLGERAEAQRAVSKALSLDDANVLALIYRAQLALDRGELAVGTRSANKLLLVERGSALGHLLRARASARRRDFDGARQDLQAALRSNPGLLSAEIELAVLDLKAGDEDPLSADQVLRRAFTIEPTLLGLRRALHTFER